MLHATASIDYRRGTSAAITPSIVGVDRIADESNERRHAAIERALDEVLAESFPASDPPSWNPGMARPGPVQNSKPDAQSSNTIVHPGDSAGASDISEVSRPSGVRTFLQGVVSLVGAASIALLLPFVILLVALPVVLVVRGALEVIRLLFGVNVQ